MLNEQELLSICEVLANNSTHTEINRYLNVTGIENKAMEKQSTPFGYISGDSKVNKLFKSFKNEYERNGANKILVYIQNVSAPIQFTNDSLREKYIKFLEDMNKVLLFLGCKINDKGEIVKVDKAKTLSEVDERVNHLKKELLARKIHREVLKYCVIDFLEKDYFDAINEAVKGAFNRVREITNIELDGCKLLQKAFAKEQPYIFFNKQATESDWNEHNGLKEMLQALFHMVRNPLSHTPKIEWNIQEEKALDILTVVSFVHKYLDECHRYPLADQYNA